MNIRKILSELTLREKIAICSGRDIWHTKPLEALGIPSAAMADGPHGLRKQVDSGDILGMNEALAATCFPTAVTTACSWDEALLESIGQAIGREAAAQGVGMVLGPGVNIKRNPLCGRNFEYFSEDPLLAGKLAAAWIRGMQSTGVSACLKHFAANSQECKRFLSDSVMDERTLREIYLTAFETAIKEGRPGAVMCAYNKLNGTHCSDSRWLLTDVLRAEWGFDGLVVTDWGALNSRIKGFQAGCDLAMPGGVAYQEAEAEQAVLEETLSEADVDASAERVLSFVQKAMRLKNEPADLEAHHALACRAAAQSAVLLKNDHQLLPLQETAKIALIGHMARELRIQGSGSSRIRPWKLNNLCEICPEMAFAEGYSADGSTSEEMIQKAVQTAENAEYAVVVVGLTEREESEGFDRKTMVLSEGQNHLVEAVVKANPNTVVVLLGGSPVEMPWADSVPSILYMGLPGQAGAQAICDLLFGRCNPGGRLAESWPMRYEDCVSSGYYGQKDAHYREGIYVGYRYYDTARIPVRYPFGHGLSYTRFAYDELRMENGVLHCRITNIGEHAGSETAMLFVSPENSVYRPERELKGFCKLHLQPGESAEARFEITDRSFAVWHDGWVVPGGWYTLSVGDQSLRVFRKEADFTPDEPAWYRHPSAKPTHDDFEALMGREVKESTVCKGSFTMQNSVMEMKEKSWVMKLLYRIVRKTVMGGPNAGKDETDPTVRMMLETAAGASLGGMKQNSGMKNYLLEGMLEMANGHWINGIRTMCRKWK